MTTKTFICTFLLVTCAISSAFSASRTWPASCRGAGDPLTDPPGLQFDMDPTAYCSITDGATYTWNEYLENGSVRGAWSPTPPTQIGVGATARVTGYGWADLSISWSSGGGTSGSRNTSEKVGCFIIITAIPESKKKDNALISVVTWPLNFNSGTFGQYDLTLSGTMSLQAVYWKPEAGIPVQGGTWERNPGEINSKSIPSATTNWTVKKQRRCPKCGQGVSYFSQHKITCTGCSRTYYKCTARKLKAAESYGETDGWEVNGVLHWQVRCSRCRALEWECARGDAVSTHKKKCASCGENYWYCRTADPHTCSPTNGNSDTGDSNGGTTTSPTVSNNGGTVSSGGSDNGRNSGDSSNRVRCGYSRCSLGGYASSRTAHQSTCPRGHVFWTCKRGTGYGNDYHGDRTCVRSGCGETFTRCSNAHRGSNPCRFNRGGWHTD